MAKKKRKKPDGGPPSRRMPPAARGSDDAASLNFTIGRDPLRRLFDEAHWSDHAGSRPFQAPPGYQERFADLRARIAQAGAVKPPHVVVCDALTDLGTSRDEIYESLSRLADAGVPVRFRGCPDAGVPEPPDYAEKHGGLIRQVEELPEADFVIVAEPWVIGDTYEELITSFGVLNDTDIALHVAKRQDRARPPELD